MFDDDAERPPTSLRGRISDVYFPALLGDLEEPLGVRLGARATVYNPLFGSATGLTPIRRQLHDVSAWLGEHVATYAHAYTLVGVDRDVSEGTLGLRTDGHHVELPVAIVAERRKAREIDVRVFHATRRVGAWQAARSPRPPADRDHAIPGDVAAHLAALRLGDPDALVVGFEADGALRDGAGATHARANGKLREFYVRLLQSERGGNDWVPIVRSSADDGRTCAIEYETEKLRGDETAPKEGLLVFERGDNGLFRSVRLYDEVGFDE